MAAAIPADRRHAWVPASRLAGRQLLSPREEDPQIRTPLTGVAPGPPGAASLIRPYFLTSFHKAAGVALMPLRGKPRKPHWTLLRRALPPRNT
jgi:hypothetical protein